MSAQQSSETENRFWAVGRSSILEETLLRFQALETLSCFSQLSPLSFSSPSLLEYSSVANQPTIIEALIYSAKSICAISGNHFNFSELRLPYRLLVLVFRMQDIPTLLISQGREESQSIGARSNLLHFPSVMKHREMMWNATGHIARNRTLGSDEVARLHFDSG